MNAFEHLGFEPRPWLDSAEITRRFQERAAALHPDRDGGDADHFAELNAAYSTIREPDIRLRHLLTIMGLAAEGPKRPEEADLFMKIGMLLQSVARLRAELAAATTPLRRALLSREAAKCREGVRHMQLVVEGKWERQSEELREIDRNWPDVPAARLALFAENLTFLRRWRRELESAEAELGA